jgi:hypothetical protein
MTYYSPNAMNTIRLLRPVLATPNAPGVIHFTAGVLTGVAIAKAFVDTVEGVGRLVRRF